MTKTVIFDVDGTLADCDHRRHHVDQHPKNWDAFFAEMDKDTPKRDVIALHDMVEKTGVAIVYCTGRGEEYRAETEAWLRKHVCKGATLWPLLMRPAGDSRPDEIMKKEMLDALRSQGRTILFTVDDRQRVVDMWRREGLTCFQCAPGDFNPLTREDVTARKVLTLLVGPSGAGKSTLAATHFHQSNILSSDRLRQEMTGDFKDQSKNHQVFAYIKETLINRINYGLHTVIDATHLKRQDRVAMTSLVPPEARIQYVVVDRPLEEKLRDGGWRLDVKFPQADGSVINLVEKHHQTFQSGKKFILNGDGLPNVTVVDMRK